MEMEMDFWKWNIEFNWNLVFALVLHWFEFTHLQLTLENM